jgi:uncharacterized protein YndB with AHSA1/START domain
MKLLLFLAMAAAWAQNAPSFINEGIVDAPVAEVWKVWTTSDAYKSLGPALADVDLRIGGLIHSRYSADGTLGDEETIENQILAFEPQRTIAIQIHRPPKTFPFQEAWKHTWTVVTLTDLGGETHVRAASMGYGTDAESLAMRQFFERGNQQTLDPLQKHFAGGTK